ncbi:MAG: serine hydrolase domain-containing protein, partial [Dehalococcoidia bacterium]
MSETITLNIEKLEQDIQDQVEFDTFSGVVAIFQGNIPIIQKAYGYADIANKRKNKVNTKFAIASGTKFFTALSIGRLIDEGKLTPDTTVHEVFRKDFSYIDSQATISQIMTHTSGIYDYYDEELITDSENFTVEIPWSQLETPTDYLPLFNDKKAKYSPGERFSYSNGGYIFLGIIIEHITGQLYRDYIQESVFDPASMNDSGYFAFDELPENTAYGYKKSRGGIPETNINNLPIRGASDGGAYTTASDLNKFWQAVFDYKILSKGLTEVFLQPYVNNIAGTDYGYGVYITRFKDIDMFFIQGGDAGVGFDSSYIPEKELQITIISNNTDGEERMREV